MCSSDESFFLLPRWTKVELKKFIAMLQNPEFDLWLCELEDVVQEIMEDPIFKGNQNFKFEIDLDEAGINTQINILWTCIYNV